MFVQKFSKGDPSGCMYSGSSSYMYILSLKDNTVKQTAMRDYNAFNEYKNVAIKYSLL